jgi:hypothetical protein
MAESTGGTEQDRLLLLRDLAKILPYPHSYASVRRWAIKGTKIRGADVYVKLETVTLPGGMASSLKMYQSFVENITKEKGVRNGDGIRIRKD